MDIVKKYAKILKVKNTKVDCQCPNWSCEKVDKVIDRKDNIKQKVLWKDMS
jgi:hypothetical protein